MSLEEFRRRQAQTKRRAVLDAARAALLADGFDRTTMEAIASGAGVSTATVYSHFGSKTALFAAVVEDAMAGLTLDAGADLKTAARAYAHLMMRPDVRGLLRLVAAESPRFPELGDALFEHGKALVYSVFSEAFAAEAAAGRIAPREDWTLAASQLSGMIMQSTLMPWIFARREPVRDADAVADAAVAVFLRE